MALWVESVLRALAIVADFFSFFSLIMIGTVGEGVGRGNAALFLLRGKMPLALVGRAMAPAEPRPGIFAPMPFPQLAALGRPVADEANHIRTARLQKAKKLT